MKLRPSKTLFVVALVLCQTMVLPLFAAQETPPVYLKWDSDTMPILYYVDDHVAIWPEGIGAIIRAFMSWERIPGAYVRFQYAGTIDEASVEGDGYNIVTWVTEGWPYGSDTVASAVLRVSPEGTTIVGFDILLNAQDFVWGTDGSPEAMDVQNVTTHELGHALGLEHSVSSTSVTMFPVILPGETRKRSLSGEEERIIHLAYPTGRTRADTYTFSGTDATLNPERAVADYPPEPESGSIFLLTRVDADGDGLDEIGILEEQDGVRTFSLFPAVTSETRPSSELASDAWYIPGRNTPMDITAVDIDGDGREEIAVLRAENNGTYSVSIYDTPAPFSFIKDDVRDWVVKQTFNILPGDNILAIAGLDYDRDGVDEIAALRLTPQGAYFLDIYSLRGRNSPSRGRVTSLPLGSNLWFVDLDVSDVNGDGNSELIALWKGGTTWYVSAFELPDSTAPANERELTLLSTAPVSLPAGYIPFRLSSLRIADGEGLPRPAICVVMSQRP